MTTLVSKAPFQSILWLRLRYQWLYNIVLILAGACLIGLGAKAAVPLFPVPVTMQTLAVLFLGMSLGWRLGSSAVALYLLLGFCGVPVFAVGLLGPNLGYLFGFLLAAIIGGFLAERGLASRFGTALLTALIATLAVYAVGLPVLATYVDWKQVVAVGLLPFVWGDIAKIVILALIIPRCWKRS